MALDVKEIPQKIKEFFSSKKIFDFQKIKAVFSKKSSGFLSKTGFQTVIGIDDNSKNVLFYFMEDGDPKNIAIDRYPYRGRVFEEEFYTAFSEAVKKFVNAHPGASGGKTVIVLPDYAVVKDLISLPVLNKKAMENALRVELIHFYQNHDDLKINSYMATKSKQYAVYVVSAIRKDILTALNASCSEVKLPVYAVTYEASAASNAVAALSPKYKTASYLFLDIKEDEAEIAFVTKGKTVGSYALPFGYRILSQNRLAAEDLLFDHTPAELAVLNAKERARAKQLTMTDTEIDQSASFDEGEESESRPENEAQAEVTSKMPGRKVARKLPKFMLREFDQTPQGYAYENFRLFAKWALLQIRGNDGLVHIAAPSVILVRMPQEYHYLLDKIEEEKDENGIEFRAFTSADELPAVADRMELYGGFYADESNTSNNF